MAWVAPWLAALPLAQARNYFVSTTGSDGASGTLDQPFQTIQKAASIMVAGDTAYIRAGIYRETVTPKNSGTQTAPITFLPYYGEAVTISGAEVIAASSWTQSSGSIYKADFAWDLGDGANQVFLDGQMMIEARWPNTTLDISHPTVAQTSDGSYVDGGTALSTGMITDPNLPSRPPGYWNGATLHIALGASWIWQAGSVVGSDPDRLSFQFRAVDPALTPRAKNSYYLTGKLGELDAPGEWFADSGSSTLYFWTPLGDSPAQHVLEAKRRQLAFDLSGRKFITIQGLGLFAATVDSDAHSQYLILDGLQGQYLANVPILMGSDAYNAGVDGGIALRGNNCVLRNSTIAFSSGSGVFLAGNGHRVINNVIHDTDYSPTYASPISAGTGALPQSRQLIAYNTIYNSGRFGIYHASNFGRGRILHNEIYDFGLQTNDLGCNYTFQSDGQGTEIAYNLCHDGHGLLLNNSQPLAVGIYLDNGSSNFVVHHNVVWNTVYALELNDPGTNHRVYNNTFVGTAASFIPYGADHLEGTEIKNNIFVAPIQVKPIGAVMTNNVLPGTNPRFVDPARNNYQLQSTSPAIRAGAVIPPYTDGFSGPAPDIGAYDHAKRAWKAGAQAAAYTFSAANYGPGLASGSAAVVFGTVPFDPGVSVLVTDGAGADLPARLLYSVAAPPQLAFEVPAAAARGVSMITITNGDGTVSISSAPVFPVAPGLFSADASGTGIAAAGVVRVKANGAQSYGPVASYNTTQGRYVAIPIDLSSATDQVFLVLYGTGIRSRSSLGGVTVTVGGVNTQVSYAGSQNQFPGLDQIDVLLPRSLMGKGSVNIALTIDGQPANLVTVAIK